MFKQIAGVAQLMKQAQAMQGRLQEFKEGLERIRVTGTAGEGLVEVDASGDQRILAVRIDSAVVAGDARRLENLIVTATNDALDRAKQAAAESMQSTAGRIPGLGDMFSQFGSTP